jgi:NhaC family Na+:H+ antiporter
MAEHSTAPRIIKDPSYADAIIPVVTLIVLVAGGVYLFGLGAADGPMQVALILSSMVVALILLRNGHTWEEISKSSGSALASVSTPFFILFSVGALIGTWNMSGTIPTMVFYGIQLLHPSYFYVAAFLICVVISLGIGSSWTTAGTMGVGLVGLATMVGVSPVITAGAVISGSYVGDKLSPLSETTVLTAELAGINVLTHIRAMLWTSGPAAIIALVVFAILSLREGGVIHNVDTASELSKLDQLFWITPLNLLPLLLLVVLSFRKVRASLAILASALFAGLMAAILQRPAMAHMVNDSRFWPPLEYVRAVWLVMANGYHLNSGVAEIDSLLSRGGMRSMLPTLWIIIGAVVFGTLLEEFNLIGKLINPILLRANTTGKLIAAVVGTAIGLNIVAADQYIALVLPIRLYSAAFQKRGLKPQILSRPAADAGTVTSALVPWNSCGAFMAGTLGIPTMLYLPFCIFNIASPIMSLLLGFTGFKIEYVEPAGKPAEVLTNN